MGRQKSATNYKTNYLRKGKKGDKGNTVNKNNPQAGERGGGGKDFARDLTELMTRERRKNYWENTSIYLLNPDTAL